MTIGYRSPTHRSRYPWPQPWDKVRKLGRRRYWLGLLLVAFFVVGIGLSISHHDPIMIAATAAITSLIVAMVAFTHVVFLSPLTRGSNGIRIVEMSRSSAMCIPSLKRGTLIVDAIYVAIAVICALGPLLAHIDPQYATPRARGYQAIAPFTPVLTPLLLVPLLSRLLQKRRTLGLGLTPEGVYYWARYGCFFFSWDWIKGVRALPRGPMFELVVAEPSERPENPEENWYSRIDQFRTNNTKIQAGMFAVNPALVYYAVCYYFRHPDRRAELGTQAAVDRMRRADYPDIVREIERNGDVRWR